VTLVILAGAREHGFVLDGSGAIREHCLVDRVTHDVDLFTNQYDAPSFDRAVDEARNVLEAAGYGVTERRRAQYLAQLSVTADDGRTTEVDFAYDWRGHEPASMQIGPVLSADDAVASKTNAVYTRLEVRDFIDLDAIRTSGRYSDEQLLLLVADRDDGFDRNMFAQQLQQIARVPEGRFLAYGLDADAISRVRDHTLDWANELGETSTPLTRDEGLAPLDRTRGDQPGIAPHVKEILAKLNDMRARDDDLAVPSPSAHGTPPTGYRGLAPAPRAQDSHGLEH
jgi:hypothetical protein